MASCKYCILPETLKQEDVVDVFLTHVVLPKRIDLAVNTADGLLWVLAQQTACAEFAVTSLNLSRRKLSLCPEHQLSSLSESSGQLASLT